MGSWRWQCFCLCCLANWHAMEEAEQYPCLPKEMEGCIKSRKYSWLPLGRWVLFQYCHFISLLCGMSGHTTWPAQNVTLATWSALMWLNLAWAVVNQGVSSTILQTHATGLMELRPLPSTKCKSLAKVCALLWSWVIQPQFEEIWRLWGNIKLCLLCPFLHCCLGEMGKGSSEELTDLLEQLKLMHTVTNVISSTKLDLFSWALMKISHLYHCLELWATVCI